MLASMTRLSSPVNGGREEGNRSLLRPGDPAGHPVAGLRSVAAHVSWLVPHQHDQSRRRGGQQLAHLGHNSLQVTRVIYHWCCAIESFLWWGFKSCVFLFFAVTLRKKDRPTWTKRGYSSKTNTLIVVNYCEACRVWFSPISTEKHTFLMRWYLKRSSPQVVSSQRKPLRHHRMSWKDL